MWADHSYVPMKEQAQNEQKLDWLRSEMSSQAGEKCIHMYVYVYIYIHKDVWNSIKKANFWGSCHLHDN